MDKRKGTPIMVDGKSMLKAFVVIVVLIALYIYANKSYIGTMSSAYNVGIQNGAKAYQQQLTQQCLQQPSKQLVLSCGEAAAITDKTIVGVTD